MGMSNSCSFDSNVLDLGGCLCKSEFINHIVGRTEYYLFQLDKDYNMVVYLWNTKLPMATGLFTVKCEISRESVKLTYSNNNTMGVNYESIITINKTNSLVRPSADEHNYDHIDMLTRMADSNLTSTQKGNIIKYMRVIEIVSDNFTK